MKEPKQIRNLKNYLLRMARNKSLEYIRRRECEVPTDDINNYAELLPDDSEDPLAVRVGCEILKIPEVERQIILMHVNANMGFGEISKVMEISVAAVYRKYRKAITLLQKALKGGGEYE